MNSKHPIIIYIGQFGCQLGSHIIDIISAKRFSPFPTVDGFFSFIFVDTEPKVINSCINCPCYSRYVREQNKITGNGLASGNWKKAFESNQLVFSVLNQVRDEVFASQKDFCKHSSL